MKDYFQRISEEFSEVKPFSKGKNWRKCKKICDKDLRGSWNKKEKRRAENKEKAWLNSKESRLRSHKLKLFLKGKNPVFKWKTMKLPFDFPFVC